MTGVVSRQRASMSPAERLYFDGQLDDFLAGLDDDELAALMYDWSFWQRPAQRAPAGKWRVWAVRAGRGYGKTRTGAEETRRRAVNAMCRRIGIVAPTAGDARDIMIEGESGLLRVHPRHERPKYEPSKRRLTWPNGVVGAIYSAEEPDRLRGPEHDWVWGDEPASDTWSKDAFDNIILGLRLGRDPRCMLTGTPKPRPWLREVWKRADTVVTQGNTYENLANLAEVFIDDVRGRYEGTRMGRQELHGEDLEDIEGALWTERMLEANRIIGFNPQQPDLSLRTWLAKNGKGIRPTDRRRWQTIVAVDPPGETAECGIIAGMAPVGAQAGKDHAVILGDYSLVGRPEEWGSAVVAASKMWGGCDVYVEKNQGGDMVRSTIHAVDRGVNVKKITAVESKKARAEPVSALDEKGWIHHAGYFGLLESQMVTWVPADDKSPDRTDARVHCVRALLKDIVRAPASVSSPVNRRIPT